MLTITKTVKTINGKEVVEMVCLSTDTKPTDYGNGSLCLEMDTGKIFAYDEEDTEWDEQTATSGGGGGGASVVTIIPEQTVTITDSPVALTGVDASSLSNDDKILMRVSGDLSTYPPESIDMLNECSYNSTTEAFGITDYNYYATAQKDGGVWKLSINDGYNEAEGTYKVMAVKNTVINFSE